MKKVISYCLWGTENRYIKGMLRNIQLARDIYPGWHVYVYLGKDADTWLVEALEKTAFEHDVPLEIWHRDIADWRLMLDRFRAILEPGVDVMISRDADSRLTLREKAAVDEWLASDYGAHSISDHPHHSLAMMGGLCGFKKHCIPANFSSMLDDWQFTTEAKWQQDQDFLNQKLLPLISNHLLRHDDFFRHIFGGQAMPITRDGYEFCGATINSDETYVASQITALRPYL